MIETISIHRIDPDVPLPRRVHGTDAGIDLYAAEAVRIGPGERAQVSTGVAVGLPDGVVGLVSPRSGLALEHGVTVLNAPGIVDRGYTGELKVVLVNLGTKHVVLEAGSRIAQLVPVRLCAAPIEVVESLPGSARGAGGFGSTGH